MSKECIDCKNRYVGCHDTCEDYIEYKKNIAKAKKEKKKGYEYKSYMTNKLWREKRV